MARHASWIIACAFLVFPSFVLGQAKETVYRPPLDAAAIEKSLGTEWFGLYLAGNKIGWARVSFDKAGDAANPLYVARMDIKGKVKSFGVETVMDGSETNEFDGTPPYRFRGGTAIKSDGKTKQVIDLVRTEQGYDVTISVGKDKTQKSLQGIDYILADQLAPDVWIRGNPKAGDTILTRGFSFDELAMDDTRRKVLNTKTGKVGGVDVIFHDVEVVMIKDDIKGKEVYDSTGKHLSMDIGGVLEMRLESEADAKNNQFSQDLFVLGMVKIDQGLGQPDQVIGLTLEVTGQGALALKSCPGQSVSKGKNGAVICKLGPKNGDAPKATPKEIEDALAESVTYPIKHARVVALAKEAVGDAKSDQEKVHRLIQFCHRYIKPSYTAQPLNLLELLDKKRGDCSEYALLFTVLARAAGIPARELSGLVYMGDDAKAFGMHAWNEVLLDGRWTPVDASCNQRSIDATHVCFGHGLRGGLELAATIGKLKFKVIDVEKKN